MERFVGLVRLTSKGREQTLKAGDYFAQIMEIVQHFGGKIEETWAVTAGPFDLCSATTYPDRISALKARTQIKALGVCPIEGYPVIEMSEYLQAVTS